MASFTAGTTFSDGVANDVTAAKLGVLVTNATPTSGFIQDRTAETVIASNDTVLIGDASDSNNLKRITVDNLMKADMTGNINSTSGTIGTFNSTTGTIPTLVATTLITTGAGTVTAPAISPTGDSNNGLFFPAADNIAVSTNGAERVRVDSSGNVGVGGNTITDTRFNIEAGSTNQQYVDVLKLKTTNTGDYHPSIVFESNRASNSRAAKISLDGGTAANTGDLVYMAQGMHAFRTGGTTGTSGAERLRIDSSGNVLVNTTANDTGAKLEVKQAASGTGFGVQAQGNDNPKIQLRLASGSTGVGGEITSNGGLVLSPSNTERLRITSGGLVLIGATSDGGNEKLRVEGSNDNFITRNVNSSSNTPEGVLIQFTAKAPNNTSQHYLYCSDIGAVRMTIRSNGGIANYQANNVNLSDERIKEGIQPSPSYLDKICSIPVVNFKYKDQTHDDYNLGVIAQQVESVCPELVDSDGFGETPNDGEPLKSIYQTDLQYALMKCIQELKAENDNLKTRIEALEAA